MEKGILFLSGGGDKKDSYLLDKEFSKVLKRKLLYIPIAIDIKEHPYSECFKWIKDIFAQFSFDNIEMWTYLRNKTIKDLENFDAIYIGGGNTFKLLKEIRDSGFDKLLLKFYNQGRSIYGGSAGAIIFGKSIITTHDENEVNLKNLKGLSLCKDYSILCHYKPEVDDKNIKMLLKKEKIIALPENSGIIIKNNVIKDIGKIFVFE